MNPDNPSFRAASLVASIGYLGHTFSPIRGLAYGGLLTLVLVWDLAVITSWINKIRGRR